MRNIRVLAIIGLRRVSRAHGAARIDRQGAFTGFSGVAQGLRQRTEDMRKSGR
jgi:hypothetical protein